MERVRKEIHKTYADIGSKLKAWPKCGNQKIALIFSANSPGRETLALTKKRIHTPCRIEKGWFMKRYTRLTTLNIQDGNTIISHIFPIYTVKHGYNHDIKHYKMCNPHIWIFTKLK